MAPQDRDTLKNKGEILVVDDTQESRQLLADLLCDSGYTVREADSGEQALFETLAHPPDLILLDIRMPGMDGFEVCRRLKESESSRKIPVMFVSVQNATADQVRGFHCGAVDFVCKPFRPEEVLARVDTHICLTHTRRMLEAERARLELRVYERTRELQSEMDTRRMAEERLHIYQRVFETTGDGMFITDAEAKLIEVNPAYCRIMGYSRNDVIGRRPGELRVDDGESDSVPIWDALREHGHWAGEFWDRRANGEEFPKWLEINIVEDRENDVLTHYIGVFSDISSLRRTEEKLKWVASHDALTGLPNRAMFRERLAQEITVCKRHDQRMAVMFIDLDKFKNINDSLGHDAGDFFLIEAAQALRQGIREGDIVARLGGDEFMVALRNIRDAHAAIHVANKLVQRFGKSFAIASQDVYSGASIGIALYPDDGADVDELIKRADSAMYCAKAAGRGQYQFYSAEIDRLAQNDLALENNLHVALDRNEFEVHFQPQMDLASGGLIGAEALLRWHHPQLGLIPPDRFIPKAEESGLIVPIGFWVIRETCRRLKEFSTLAGFPLSMAINLSPRQFQQSNLSDEIARIVAEEGVAASQIELEVTETTAMADAEAAAVILQQLADRDFSIAIDDFGTGYSSLAYLRRFPVNKLKIDRSFVKDIPGNTNDAAIASAVIQLAKSLGLRVVAEGVETEAQRNFLTTHGCDLLQGYWYAKPMNVDAFSQFIAAGQGHDTCTALAEPGEY